MYFSCTHLLHLLNWLDCDYVSGVIILFLNARIVELLIYLNEVFTDLLILIKNKKIDLLSLMKLFAIFMQLKCIIYMTLLPWLCFLLIEQSACLIFLALRVDREAGLWQAWWGRALTPGPAASAPVWYELSEDYGYSEPEAFGDQVSCVLSLIELPGERKKKAAGLLQLFVEKIAARVCGHSFVISQSPKTKHLRGIGLVAFGSYAIGKRILAACCCHLMATLSVERKPGTSIAPFITNDPISTGA